jgi:hypothetical protein
MQMWINRTGQQRQTANENRLCRCGRSAGGDKASDAPPGYQKVGLN